MKRIVNKFSLTVLFIIIYGFSTFSQTTGIDSLRQVWRNEADTLFKYYTAYSIDTLRGLTPEEWREGVNEIYEKINKCNTQLEYLYTLRYFGALINDRHGEFPDNGFYNYTRIFRKTDTIFPVWVKSWYDGRVFAVRDFSEQTPAYSEIISINGIPAKDIALKQRKYAPFENRFTSAWMSSVYEGDPLYWTNFANWLFCENIRHPYNVEYKSGIDSITHKITLPGLQREEINRMYKEGEGKEASKEGFALIFSSGKNAITYSKINDSTGILTIKDFTSSLVRRLLTGTDPGFPKKLSKAMKQIRKDGVKHLIIDLRDNTGGYIYNAYELMSYFTDEKFAAPVIYKITDRSRKLAAKMLKREYKIFYGKQRHPDILRSMEIFKSMPDGSVFRSDTVLPMQYPPKPEEYRYRGKTYLLTNGLTYSASIMFTNLFKTYTAGLLAGESPGGYSVVFSGDAPIVELPCSNMWLNMTFFSTGTDRKYKYIEPDIPIEPTLEEWLYGKHDSLEKLLAMIMENKISRE